MAIVPGNAGGTEAQAYTLDPQQDVTVMFTLPVIALGSDYDSADFTTGDKKPFAFYCANQGGNTTENECDIPGTLRWVTTSIARFTPNSTWPTGKERRIGRSRDGSKSLSPN